jgi:hypothetical protein
LGRRNEEGDVRVEAEGQGVKALIDFGVGKEASEWKMRTLGLEMDLRAVSFRPLRSTRWSLSILESARLVRRIDKAEDEANC